MPHNIKQPGIDWLIDWLSYLCIYSFIYFSNGRQVCFFQKAHYMVKDWNNAWFEPDWSELLHYVTLHGKKQKKKDLNSYFARLLKPLTENNKSTKLPPRHWFFKNYFNKHFITESFNADLLSTPTPQLFFFSLSLISNEIPSNQPSFSQHLNVIITLIHHPSVHLQVVCLGQGPQTLLSTQLKDFLSDINILSNFQSGFRKQPSTTNSCRY